MWRLSTALLLGIAINQAGAQTLRIESDVARVGLLELYTSEGCSSCPPADRWLSRLVEHPELWKRVVPVAFHVDYWDYIGWQDRFASPAFSDRQRRYAATGAVHTVYTPGLVFAGEEWRGWFRDRPLDIGAGPAVGTLAVEVEDGRLRSRFTPAAELPEVLELHVAVLGFGLSTEVGAGENRGRTLKHDFVVLGHGHARLRSADGYSAELELPAVDHAPEATALAAWVSAIGDPRPLQAAGGWLD